MVPQGPVIFSEVLRFAADFAKFCKEQDSKYYVVLVIMTCKDLADIEAFKKELEKSYQYPLSVIICRVVPLKKTSTTLNDINPLRSQPRETVDSKTGGEKDGETDTHSEPRNNETQHNERFLKTYQQISQELKESVLFLILSLLC